ncbi:MCE family protein [Streptomyces sp. HNM0663]|uniref:MCE family protein n=1 Tax=Streptomyces chengmaiensis TaxID=3040919 RepID=A0ABT6HRB9_9ACTN|nr:MCE family protein [Streptomyces chengmaiensis]MDH2390895.1 MCE family protein [Streptomyces chengmaiensis]
MKARRTRTPRTTVLWAAAGSLLLTGCEFHGLHDVPLPGGAAADGRSYRVTVEFRDVLDLVPQSTVKVNNVTVGAVEKVELDGWHARVRLRIADSVRLPANALAEIRQTSMLGEKYVALSPPPEGGGAEPVGRLSDGDRIPLARSGRNPEIEEVLSALSALLNGGGVAQLKTVTTELNKALDGREDRVKSLLFELKTFLGGLDAQKKEIVRALEGIDKLSATLAKEKKTIGQAVTAMPPALKVLADQRPKLTAMLRSLSELGVTGTRVVNASRDDVIANLRALQPILKQLNKAGADLPNALELLTTYPFPRNVVDAIKGDYVNLKVTADLDLRSLYGNLAGEGEAPPQPGDPAAPTPELPEVPEGPELPGLPGLPESPELPQAPQPPGTPDEPSAPDLPGGGDGNGDGAGEGDADLTCLPFCPSAHHASYQSTYAADGRYPPGIDTALAGLLLKGLLP